MKKVFITGGSGTVGEAFISQFYGQYQFVSFSRNEKMQVALKRNFPDVEIILGAVEDKPYLLNSILNEKPDIVIHAAALKHVDSAEKSPIAAVKSNIIGSLNVIDSCIEAGVMSSIAISTDKACAPDSNYGQTKALMEQMFLEAHNERCKFNVCRFGNVSHSHGSVIPYWLRLKESGQPLPLTHKDMNRLVISRADSARLVHDAVLKSENDDQPFILTKRMKSVNMYKLAQLLSSDINIVGLRPGEKLNETLISKREIPYLFAEGDHLVIRKFENQDSPVLEGDYASDNADFMTDYEMRALLADTSSDMGQTLLKSKIY